MCKTHFTFFLKETVVSLKITWETPIIEYTTFFLGIVWKHRYSYRNASLEKKKKVQIKTSCDQSKASSGTFGSYKVCVAPISQFKVCGYSVTYARTLDVYDVTLTREH